MSKVMTTKSLVGVAAIAGFVAYCFQRGATPHVERSRGPVPSEDIKRWDGEGGTVPAVSTPSPAPQPQSSYPDGDSARRH